jgi:hypothetical protein
MALSATNLLPRSASPVWVKSFEYVLQAVKINDTVSDSSKWIFAALYLSRLFMNFGIGLNFLKQKTPKET